MTKNKPWYEDEDPDIHSGIYFPRNSQMHRRPHQYEEVPYSGHGVPPEHHWDHRSPSHRLVPPMNGGDEQQHLAQQRLDYYFSRQQDVRGEMVPSPDRRESSPARYGKKSRYRTTIPEPLNERKHSDSEVYKSQVSK